jgi:hypothetical protein
VTIGKGRVIRMRQAARLREAVVPDWLAEVVRLHRAPVPWAAMGRAAMAICGPLAVAFAVGQRALGVLVAMAACRALSPIRAARMRPG